MTSGFLRGVNETCALLDVTQRRLVVNVRCAITYRSHLKGSISTGMLDP